MLWWRSSCATVAGPWAATRTKSPPPQPGLNAWTRYGLSRYPERLPTSALAWPRRRGFQWGHFKPMKSNGGSIFQSDNHWVLSLLSHHPCELLEVHEINLKIPFWIDGHKYPLQSQVYYHPGYKPACCFQFHSEWGRSRGEQKMLFLGSCISLVLDPAVILLKLLSSSKQNFL